MKKPELTLTLSYLYLVVSMVFMPCDFYFYFACTDLRSVHVHDLVQISISVNDS